LAENNQKNPGYYLSCWVNVSARIKWKKIPTIPICSSIPATAAAAFGFMNFEAGELGWHVATA
jgi:hypothetical protein